jgi:restriction system protein
LIDEIALDPHGMLQLTPGQFEELVTEIWMRLGYEVELTARTRDGGRDVVAVRRGEAELRFLIECKRYAPDNKVGVQVVRALFGVLHDEQANKAIVATTASFTKGAIEFVEKHRWLLELCDFNGIRDWARRVRGRRQRPDSTIWTP